jgi:hypothetical protein
MNRFFLSLRDFTLFVNRVFAAARAKLFNRELLRGGALVFIGDVIVALTILTGQFDEVSHGELLR